MSVFIIAEAGVNHNGDFATACRLIDAAAGAGADAVKFQTFKAERLVTKTAAKAGYQQQAGTADESQFEMLQQLELKPEWHYQLKEYCHKKNIVFLSTAFDFGSLHFLADELGVARLKIASGEITNGPFLLAHAQTRKPILLSTGMATLAEIEIALGVLAFGYLGLSKPSIARFRQAYEAAAGQDMLKQNVTLLHCTSEYPTPMNHVNLSVMDQLRTEFELRVGYSDHSIGLSVPIAAAARGACVIEKHFTLDRGSAGPDHQVSLEPDELKQMVQSIREIEQALGRPEKAPQAGELANRQVVRRSLVAAQAISAGEVFTEANITVKRPGTGKSPMAYWELLGQSSDRAYAADELL